MQLIHLLARKNSLPVKIQGDFNSCEISEYEHEKFALSSTSVKGKGKAIPLQAWTGPEGSRNLRLPDFKTVGS